MTAHLKATVVKRAAGNPRSLAIIGACLPAAAIEGHHLDEQIFIDTFGDTPSAKRGRR